MNVCTCPFCYSCMYVLDPLKLSNRGFRSKSNVPIFDASWTRIPGQTENPADAMLTKKEKEKERERERERERDKDETHYMDPNLSLRKPIVMLFIFHHQNRQTY